jgi:hypothetical protein
MAQTPGSRNLSAKVLEYYTWRYLRKNQKLLILPNISLPGYAYESDVVAITKAGYFSEYEIKVTRSDFRRDFEKVEADYVRDPESEWKWNKVDILKHDMLAGGKPKGDRDIKPKRFTFVVPEGLVEPEEVPEHCGLFYYTPETHYRIKIIRPAPTLKGATKLGLGHITNFAIKASSRLYFKTNPEKP